jgi:hypothetical protein
VISGTCVAAHNSAAIWMMNVGHGFAVFDSDYGSGGIAPFFLSTPLAVVAL